VNIPKASVSILLLLLALSFVPQTFAQTESLGSVKYTPPKGWTKSPKGNVAIFSDINQTSGIHPAK
jgi:hypothetical protein